MIPVELMRIKLMNFEMMKILSFFQFEREQVACTN